MKNEELLRLTQMPTWEQIYRRALKLNINDFKTDKRLFGNLITNTGETFAESLTTLRKKAVDHIQATIFKTQREGRRYERSWRTRKHPITGFTTHYLDNERCPL